MKWEQASDGSGNEIERWQGPAHHTEILVLIPREMGRPGGILSMILFTF